VVLPPSGRADAEAYSLSCPVSTRARRYSATTPAPEAYCRYSQGRARGYQHVQQLVMVNGRDGSHVIRTFFKYHKNGELFKYEAIRP
jgi:hypothetical protein